MKKLSCFFLLGLMVFGICGCNKTEVVKNAYSLQYKEVKSKEDVIYNLNNVINETKAISFNGYLVYKGKKWNLDGNMILNETIYNSFVDIHIGNLNLYIQKGIVYISYLYKNRNFVVKDSLYNFVEEVVVILKEKGVDCNRDVIMNFINNFNIRSINAQKLLKYVEGDLFRIRIGALNVKLNEKCFLDTIAFNKNDVSLNISVNYDEVKIVVPDMHFMWALDIKDLKSFLKVTYLSDLV